MIAGLDGGVRTCVLLPANTRCLVGPHQRHCSYTFSLSKVECFCSLPSSVLRERAGRGGEEGEAVVEEESQTGNQSRQDGEQSSGESTPCCCQPASSSGPRALSICLSKCLLLVFTQKTARV